MSETKHRFDLIKQKRNQSGAKKGWRGRSGYCHDDLYMDDTQALTIVLLIAEEYEDDRLWQDKTIDDLDKKPWAVQVRNAIIQVKRLRKAIEELPDWVLPEF